MNVFNLTDIDTPKLQAYGLVGHSFVVGGVLIEPGQQAKVLESQAVDADLRHLRAVGAAALEAELPNYYFAVKYTAPAASLSLAADIAPEPVTSPALPQSKRRGGG